MKKVNKTHIVILAAAAYGLYWLWQRHQQQVMSAQIDQALAQTQSLGIPTGNDVLPMM